MRVEGLRIQGVRFGFEGSGFRVYRHHVGIHALGLRTFQG